MSTEASLRFTIEFPHQLNVWVLQIGGWLPIQFTGASLILVDRCVTIAAQKLALNPDRTDMEADRWWLAALNRPGFALNAILCAAEGWTASEPTYESFCAELRKATDNLVAQFPNAKVIRHDPQTLPAVYDTIAAIRERQLHGASFLRAIAPLLTNRVAANRVRKVERQLIEAAKANSLDLHSFVVLAGLSCLYEPQHGEHPRIGRGVLKFTPSYTAEQMHNALADLRSLEYLAISSGLPGAGVGLCTRDKALAAFWTYLGVSEPTWHDNSFSAKLAPQPELFGRLSREGVQELLTRLQ
jgi:hypothetical protein